jgi:hypothetical protein
VTQPVEPVPKIRCDCPAPGISPIFSLSKRGGSISKKLWERKQGGTMRERGLNREGGSLLEEMSGIPPIIRLSYKKLDDIFRLSIQ